MPAFLFPKCRDFWWNIRLYRQSNHAFDVENPTLVVDLHENVFHRYLYCFVFSLLQTDCNILLRYRFSVIAGFRSYARNIMKFERLKIGWSIPTDASMIFCSRPLQHSHSSPITHLTPEYFVPEDKGSIHLNFPLHPTWLENGLWTNSARSQSVGIRRIKVFFAGNASQSDYDHRDWLNGIFNMPTRWQSINFLKEHLSSDKLALPNTLEELNNGNYLKQTVLVTSNQFRLETDNYRIVLAESDFFLCLPGGCMPLCHNIGEAMSQGCIPIVAYPHLMHPPLEDGVNCLVYKDNNELLQKLDLAQSMPEAKVKQMANEALQYYQRHLCPKAVGNKILNAIKDVSTIRLCAELSSACLLRNEIGSKIIPQ